MDTKAGLHVSNVSCIRHNKKIFTNLSFSIQPGKLILLMGTNGSGKSSLLRILCGLATPYEGDIIWFGKRIETIRAEYREAIHFIGHSNGNKLGLTVLENIVLTEHLQLTSSPAIDPLLLLFKLDNVKHTLVKNLSAGQKRRLTLAKLILFKKTLWILDEPTTSLDTEMEAEFLSLLRMHLKTGGMGIISSHQSIVLPDIPTEILRLGIC